MPHCYALTVCLGSSLDQHTSNISLFSLVEQINVPPGAPPPPKNTLPLEVHCYFRLQGDEVGRELFMRFVLLGQSGLSSYSEVHRHRPAGHRFRTRTLGVPFPPGPGHYDLYVEFRNADGDWLRDPLCWPMSLVEARPASAVTH
jgi:hypothetical protein